MAQTSAAVQAVLGTNAMDSQILMAFQPWQGTLQQWLVRGGVSHAGRTRMVTTTASDSAATQAAAILTALAV